MVVNAVESVEREIAMQYTLALFDKFKDKLTYGISQRDGGVSKGCYRSLNLGLHVGDENESVIENRKRFCGRFGAELSEVVCCEQVHGTNVRAVNYADRGHGAFSLTDTVKGTDGLITDVRNLTLMLFFADCAPLLVYDPEHKAIGLSHAGWRGTVGNIAAKTLQAMHTAYNTQSTDCIAAIGPCIGQCCYTVGREVYEKFKKLFSSAAFSPLDLADCLTKTADDKYQLSLFKANKILLMKQGVQESNIATEHCCTSCNKDRFFSYRAENGKTGRHAVLLYLK